MKPDSDNIEKLIFAFEYEDKSLASKCNTIIESIFKTQIFPEIKNAIDNKIPKELTIQLESLEIDIGTINEKELPTFLAKKIIDKLDKALRYELNLKINQKSIHINESAHSQESDYSIVALEYYLKRGYFPSWFDTGKSLDGLISTLMESSKDDFFQMLGKYRINEAAMSRLKNILSLKIYNEIYPLVKSNSLQVPKKLLNKNTKVSMENDFTDEIRVNNAGLIIFWPFLTRLFEQLNLVENGLFISKSARNRAIYLLQYMVNNTTDNPEFELVLNKILVGMPISEHLDPIENLSLEEKNMTVSLINGLIANWEKVRDASPAAIQETFVQREGFLLIKEENMHLKINKKGVDVLLMSIPWNLSLIKLPWMEKPLHIEWI